MTDQTSSAGKSTTGLDQNIAGALTYLGGAVTGVLFLIIDKDNKFVRFHAMQSTITFVAVLVLSFVFFAIPIIGWILYPLFMIGVLVLWLFLMYKAFNGQMYKLPYVGDLAEKQLG
jgi:uncharacterized membrane protein